MTTVARDKITINPRELKARLGGADDSASRELADSVAEEIWALEILQAQISDETLQAAKEPMCLPQP